MTPNDDGFSDIPRVRSLTVNPRFYLYPSEKATLWLGINAAFENRTGGDLEVIENGPSEGNRFSEQNLSERVSSQLRYEQEIGERSSFIVKIVSEGLTDRLQFLTISLKGCSGTASVKSAIVYNLTISNG